jgi:membrane protein DedA with SNARE-associated domain
MSLQELISSYGYAAVGIGTFFEGETVLALGGFSAHQGYLELPWVIVCGFLGSFISDQANFYLGWAKGEAFLNKRPRWQAKSEKVLSLLDKHQIWLILGFRFLYGIRTVTPFLIGTAGISPSRFFMLNFVGASIWAALFGTMGYLFGHALETFIGDMQRYELLLFAVLAGVGIAIWAGYFMTRKGDR